MARDEFQLHDVSPVFQRRLLRWLRKHEQVLTIGTLAEGTEFRVTPAGGGDAAVAEDKSLERAIEQVMASAKGERKGKRGKQVVSRAFQNRVRAWLAETDGVLIVAPNAHGFTVDVSAGGVTGSGGDEDLEIALVLAEEQLEDRQGAPSAAETVLAPVGELADEDEAPTTLRTPNVASKRHVRPGEEAAAARRDAEVRQQAYIAAMLRARKGVSYEEFRSQSPGLSARDLRRAWDEGGRDPLEATARPTARGVRVSEDPDYIIQALYRDGRLVSPSCTIGYDNERFAIREAEKLARSAEFEGDSVRVITRHGEPVWEWPAPPRPSFGDQRPNGPPPPPRRSSPPRAGQGATVRRMVHREEAIRRRDERAFDPEAPRERYAKTHHFAVNHARSAHADKDILREVVLGDTGYTLVTWDTGRKDRRRQSVLGYAFYAPGAAQPLFEGEDFAGSPVHADDSDETLRSLLGFLTLRPGDTDQEYFAEYTPAQLAFTKGDAEELGLYAVRAGRGETVYGELVDVE